MLITLALVTALYTPAKPTVGDHVTVTFEQPAALDQSPLYEVVSRKSDRQFVIRTFLPVPIPISGVAGSVRFRNLVLPVKSVLRPDDDLKPAPLAPPRQLPASNLPRYLSAAAALLAAVAWFMVWKRRKHAAKVVKAKPRVPPPVAFRAAVAQAPAAKQPWAALADATREYLSAHGMGLEMTTTQIVSSLPRVLPMLAGHWAVVVSEILRRGDLEKFSPWGPPPGSVEEAGREALGLIEILDPPAPPQIEKQEAA